MTDVRWVGPLSSKPRAPASSAGLGPAPPLPLSIPHPAPLSSLMPKGNLCWSPAARGAGNWSPRAWPADGLSVGGARGSHMWGHLRCPQPAEAEPAPGHLRPAGRGCWGRERRPSARSRPGSAGGAGRVRTPPAPGPAPGRGLGCPLPAALGAASPCARPRGRCGGVRPPRSASISESESGCVAPSPQPPWSPFSLLPPPLHTSLRHKNTFFCRRERRESGFPPHSPSPPSLGVPLGAKRPHLQVMHPRRQG